MRLVEDPEAASWLDGLPGEHDDFDWDRGNATKNRKHGIEAHDIETILRSPVVLAGRII